MTQESRRRAKKMAHESIARGEPTAWFEPFYAAAAADPAAIPWADEKANPHLVTWLDNQPQPSSGSARPRAAVVGCGLGDDALELAKRGYQVTAFDLSPTAIGWCQRRFPAAAAAGVDFESADLFNTPKDWCQAFDLVFEAYTLQAIPESIRGRGAACVAELVRPGGRLLLICRAREPGEDAGSLPWPLTRAEIDPLPGLTTEQVEDFMDSIEEPPQRRFRVTYRRV